MSEKVYGCGMTERECMDVVDLAIRKGWAWFREDHDGRSSGKIPPDFIDALKDFLEDRSDEFDAQAVFNALVETRPTSYNAIRFYLTACEKEGLVIRVGHGIYCKKI